DKAEKLCLDTVKNNGRMDSIRERFTTIGGVGDLTAISILSSLPEIGTLSDGKLNRLVGIAPEEKQSGTKEWQRRIWGGRAEGHPHKWEIVPTMRKLLSLWRADMCK
ncbi:MAG: transposase, partial [Kiritimatiellae bacterium]|nr:transposase [Kiritimatiellia bacterium]